MLNCIVGIDIYIFLNFFFLWKFVLHTLVVDNYLSKSKNVSQTEILGMHRLYIYTREIFALVYFHPFALVVSWRIPIKIQLCLHGQIQGGQSCFASVEG